MNPKILNRETVAPRKPTWQQIEVRGEHPARLGDRELIQVIDDAAIRNIVSEWEKDMQVPHFDGLLVDADHLSHDSANSTEAMAWLVDLEIRNGELWGLLDWTDIGAEAVSGRRYKFFSTEYRGTDLEDLGDGRVRPRRLDGLALTNRPNNRGGKPITNRKAGDAEHNPTQYDTSMKSITEKLGLPEEATEEEILSAIASLQERAAKADDMETEAEAEEILNRHASRIPDGTRESWKVGLIANREATEKLLAAMPERKVDPPKAPEAITNRSTAKVPDASIANGGGDDCAKQQAAVLRIKNRDKCTYLQAWETARHEEPSLFAQA